VLAVGHTALIITETTPFERHLHENERCAGWATYGSKPPMRNSRHHHCVSPPLFLPPPPL
jgi:hypothetical protein